MSRLSATVDAAFALASEVVTAGRIPGAVVGAITPDAPPEIRWTGRARIVPDEAPMRRETVFDLASLTKVILTTTQVLWLVERGRVDLDDPLSRHLPDLFQYRPDAPIRRITIRQCLAHRSGLPAVEPIYTWGEGPDRLKALVLQKDWAIGDHVYSDINFILLGLLVERLAGRELADLVPAGFTARPDPAICAATERCHWRGRVMQGQTHDENAFSLGGLSGHAGLFGPADAILAWAGDLMAGRLFSRATLEELRRPQAGGIRGLGWEIRAPGWAGGSLCGPGTIGHTGFTGTGLWIDLDRNIAWTLLTNRVHPSRHVETGIQDLRRAVGNRVAAAWTGAG
jgi:CubicO group peptidase (beta-lactamase class C family)